MKNIIKDKRVEFEMTTLALSKLLGISEDIVISWESGITEPSIPEIIRISQIFNIEIDELVSELAKQKPNKVILSVSDIPNINEIENEPTNNNKVLSFIISQIKNKFIYNNKVDIDKVIKYFSIALLSGVLLLIFLGVIDSQINSIKRSNPFDEEVAGITPILVGARLGEEVIIGPLRYSSYDSDRKAITFYNPDASENESLFNLDEIEVFIGNLDGKDFKKWSRFRSSRLVFIKGISYKYINSRNFYLEAIEIREAE